MNQENHLQRRPGLHRDNMSSHDRCIPSLSRQGLPADGKPPGRPSLKVGYGYLVQWGPLVVQLHFRLPFVLEVLPQFQLPGQVLPLQVSVHPGQVLLPQVPILTEWVIQRLAL